MGPRLENLFSGLDQGLAHLASENFQAARDTFEDVLDELEDGSNGDSTVIVQISFSAIRAEQE